MTSPLKEYIPVCETIMIRSVEHFFEVLMDDAKPKQDYPEGVKNTTEDMIEKMKKNDL